MVITPETVTAQSVDEGILQEIEIDDLDWFPWYFKRLKASKRWQRMQDFERGWYVTLLVESADNSMMRGYLPNDPTELWHLAGAKTMAYFQREGRSVLECFDGRTVDGKWIFNSPLLKVLKEQTNKLRKRKSSLSLSTNVCTQEDKQDLKLPEDLSLEIWNDFWKMRSKLKIPDSPRARKGILSKLEKFRLQGYEPNDVLEESIINGWRGVYPGRENTHGSTQRQTQNRTNIARAFGSLARKTDG